MDLKNGKITLGELWDNPRSREVFQKKVPMLAKHPLKGTAREITLEQLGDFLSSWLPAPVIQGVLRDLRQL